MPDTKTRQLRETSERRLRITRVRLIISIPTLILLLTLIVNWASYQQLLQLATYEKNPVTAQRIEAFAGRFLQATLILSLVAAGLGVVLAFQIVRPIRELTQTARRLVSGDLSGRARVPDLGEFADLGSTFNKMIDHLQRIFRERNRILEGAEGASVIWLDLSGKVKSMDATNAALFSRAVQDMIGQKLIELVPHSPANEEFHSILQRELSSLPSRHLSSYIFETQLDPASPPILLGVTLALMRDETGEPSGHLIMLRNLNALRSFHNQMMRADRLAALGTFATGMAHEIRNPLASIKGMVQLMGEVTDTCQLGAYQERIVQEIGRLERLLSEVMNFAHPEPTEPESTDLERVVRESLDTAESHCNPQEHGIHIRLELAKTRPCILEPRRIHQALVNLMINAFEATPPGGEVVIQTRNLRDQESEPRPLVISIMNTGDPIPNDQAERIFEPFYTTKPNGTGLGLPIAYQIIAAHHGTLELEQEDGWITFRVALPEFPLGQ